MRSQEPSAVNLSDVSSTMLLTLYCRSMESRSKDPILHDPMAVDITSRLNPLLAAAPERLYRDLAAGKVNRKMAVFITLRAKRFDQYAHDFLEKAPGGTIVELGCGLSTRFWRADNGQVNFYDLDLPEVIRIRRKFVSEADRYRMIRSSVLDYGWMQQLHEHGGPFLFLAEGLFMYLPKNNVKDLVAKLAAEFPGCELVCEMVNAVMISGLGKGALRVKMQGQTHVGRGATFLCGIKDGREMEGWAPGAKLLDEWSHFDSNEKKLGWVRLYGKIPSMRRVQWTVHYRLGQPIQPAPAK